MDAARFDTLTRSLPAHISRRGMLFGLTAVILGLASGHFPATTNARKGKKRKKTPPFNQYGCLNVGVRCRTAGQCCSGICASTKGKKGKRGKGKQGKKRRKRCQAHHDSDCRPGQTTTDCGGFDTECQIDLDWEEPPVLIPSGKCFTTTGNAGFCATDGECNAPCSKDIDCQNAFDIAPAACAVCPDCPGGAGCVWVG